MSDLARRLSHLSDEQAWTIYRIALDTELDLRLDRESAMSAAEWIAERRAALKPGRRDDEYEHRREFRELSSKLAYRIGSTFGKVDPMPVVDLPDLFDEAYRRLDNREMPDRDALHRGISRAAMIIDTFCKATAPAPAEREGVSYEGYEEALRLIGEAERAANPEERGDSRPLEIRAGRSFGGTPWKSEAPPPGTEAKSETIPQGIGPTPKAPSETAIQCYRLAFLRSDKMNQEDIAREVYGDRKRQWKVSRDLKAVKEWIKTGNVLPNLETPRPKMIPVDPGKLDRGGWPEGNYARRKQR